MAKFYVQACEIRFIVSAEDAEGAALWMVNQIVNQIVPIEQIEDRIIDLDIIQHLVEGENFLQTDIVVSEKGFGADEAAKFDAKTLFDYWCQLLCAMHHLLDQLNQQ